MKYSDTLHSLQLIKMTREWFCTPTSTTYGKQHKSVADPQGLCSKPQVLCLHLTRRDPTRARMNRHVHADTAHKARARRGLSRGGCKGLTLLAQLLPQLRQLLFSWQQTCKCQTQLDSAKWVDPAPMFRANLVR
jgi:hypothetical protein